MCGGGHAWQGCVHGRGACVAGGMHGSRVCMARGHAWQGTCVAGGGHAWQERMPLQWTVRILLECILVAKYFTFSCTLQNIINNII